MVQGKAENIVKYRFLQKSNSDLFSLSYDHPLQADVVSWKNSTYLPRSSWAEGRNSLLEGVINSGLEYDYYIFMDDDVEFLTGSFLRFEELIEKHRPSYAVPLCEEIEKSYRYSPNLEIQHPVATDQQIQAFSKSVIDDRLIVPFETCFDKESWWYTGEINNSLTLTLLRGKCAQFNTLKVGNTCHIWNDKEVGQSTYLYGKEQSMMSTCRKYVVDKFGKREPIANTLYYPRYLPQVIYARRWSEIFGEMQSGSYLKTIKSIGFKVRCVLVNSIIWLVVPKAIINPREFKSSEI
jgi:hypothetical protein